MKRYIYLLCVIAAVLAGCDTVGPEVLVHELQVAPDKIIFENDKPENNRFTVTSNVSWNISCDETYLELDKYAGGAGETIVTVLKGPVKNCVLKITTKKSGRNETVITKEVYVLISGYEDDVTVYPWAELPMTRQSDGSYEYVAQSAANFNHKSGEYRYVTHHATTYSSKKYVRNYSACYDTRRHNPMWVAYPFHAIYEEGGRTRPKPDPWRADPKFSESEQSIIYPIDWQNYPGHTDERRWSRLEGMNNYFGRGHMLMSANRGAGSETVPFEMNVQTFYPTNISPEYHKYPKHWELVEARLTKWNCNDTVYVVTGCYYANDNNMITDASWSGITQSYSKWCVVPTAHYKVFLRTKTGKRSKPVQKCSADELMAIGFWFEQKLDSSPFEDQPALSTVTYSVADIEKKIGGEFSFFPGIPQSVKESYNINDWPGLAAIADTAYLPDGTEKK